jgi:hypothetical protein
LEDVASGVTGKNSKSKKGKSKNKKVIPHDAQPLEDVAAGVTEKMKGTKHLQKMVSETMERQMVQP